MENFTLEQLRAAHVAGAVQSVVLRADAGAFEIEIETLGGPVRLVKARSKSEARRFVDPRKALLLLRQLGIVEARVDTHDWRPEERELERQPRPDRAEAMKAAHQALTHTDWLRHKAAAATVTSRTRAPHQQVMNAAQAIINRKRKTPAGSERE
jgi:hypothetical protein